MNDDIKILAFPQAEQSGPIKISAADFEALRALPREEQEQIGDIATEAAYIRIINYLKETGRKTITEAEAGQFSDEALKAVITAHIKKEANHEA
jgi:hypothetical protein